ncbi:hypothetical protein FOA52_008648 [Chlamydomonas sp. UWO 241]|nr:hypothetical protein FOA52_008648 [Chlamydomonas sp. UWO 241]
MYGGGYGGGAPEGQQQGYDALARMLAQGQQPQPNMGQGQQQQQQQPWGMQGNHMQQPPSMPASMPQGADGVSGSLASMAASAGMTPQAMQALYQQYAMRWAMQQRFSQQGAGGHALPPDVAGMGMGQMPGMGMGDAGQLGMGGLPGPFQGMGMPQQFPQQQFTPLQYPPPDQFQQQQFQQQPQQYGGGGFGPGAGGHEGGGRTSFFKTRMCNKFKDGTCANGDTCKYAHGEAELRQPTPMGGGGRGGGYDTAMGYGQQGGGYGMGGYGAARAMAGSVPGHQKLGDAIKVLKKTRLCNDFVLGGVGACKFGDRCSFAHGEHELQARPGPETLGAAASRKDGIAAVLRRPLSVETHKTKLCSRFMQTGTCQYSSRCTFAHGEHELRSEMMGGGPQPAAVQLLLHTNGGDAAAEAYPGAGAVAAGAGAAAAAAAAGATNKRAWDGGEQAAKKRAAGAAGEAVAEPECPLCAHLVHEGRQKVLDSIMALESAPAKKLGIMIMAAAGRIDQLWCKCTPATLLDWMAKADLGIMDKIEVLRVVAYHCHDDTPQPQSDLVDRYCSMGVPRQLADFLAMVMDGREGGASMSEYFHMLEVAKAMFGVNDDTYYAVSTAVASIMMGM